MRTTGLSILVIILATSIAFSQETQPLEEDSLQTSEEPKYTLKPIVVTATRSERPIFGVPYAIDVIEKRDIQRTEVGLSLDEAVRAVPGIIVNNRHNLSRGDRINIRGIGSRAAYGVRGIKIILDGIPLTIPDGQAHLENLDLSSAGKIEILRGPSSSLYGNAAGGLINIQTQSAPAAFLVAQPQFLIGSDGLQKWQGKVSGNIGSHAYFINVNKLTLDGYRQHSSANSMSLNAIGRHTISDNVGLTSVLHYSDSPYRLNPSSLTKTDAETSPTTVRYFVKQQASGKQVRQGQGGITLRYRNGEDRQCAVTVYGISRSVVSAIPGNIFKLERASGGIRAVFSTGLQISSAQLRWTIGADFEAQKDRRTEYKNLGIPQEHVETASKSDFFDLLQYGDRTFDQDDKVFGLGPFTQLEFSLSPAWLMTLGERYDLYTFEAEDHFMDDGRDDSGTRTMDKFSPMLGVIYRPREYLKVYANYSSAFQTPTTVELSSSPDGSGGFNPSIEPELTLGYEVGIKGIWPPNRFNYDVALYILDIEDMLIPYQIPDPESENVYYRNAGKTRNKGTEIKLDWSPVAGLRTSFAYHFMDFTFEDFKVETSVGDTVQLVQLDGNEVPGVAPQQIFAGMTYEHPVGAYSEINLRWVDQYYANDFNGPPPGIEKPIQDFVNDAYLVFDLRLGFQHNFDQFGVEFITGINNLFDERYNGSIVPNAFGDQFYEPAPGRNWYSGCAISFPGSGNK
jgi:iron complex outermembrane receptor protein